MHVAFKQGSSFEKGDVHPMSKKRLATIFVAAAALLMLTACGGGDGNSKSGNTGGQDSGGAVVAEKPAAYNNRCLSCHGTDLKGNVGGKSNISNVGARLSRDEIYDTIANGKKGTSMPAFGNVLSEDEINELADWLASLK
jgi:cytochrome c551